MRSGAARWWRPRSAGPRGRGACELALEVTSSNPAAIELYRSTGFIDTGRRGQLRPGTGLTVQTLVARLARW